MTNLLKKLDQNLKKNDRLVWNAEHEIIDRLPVDAVFLSSGDDTQKGTSIIAVRVETKNLEKRWVLEE